MNNEAIICEIKKAEQTLSEITAEYVCETNNKKANLLFLEIEEVERFITNLKKCLEE